MLIILSGGFVLSTLAVTTVYCRTSCLFILGQNLEKRTRVIDIEKGLSDIWSFKALLYKKIAVNVLTNNNAESMHNTVYFSLVR